jgi:hypothetical protein
MDVMANDNREVKHEVGRLNGHWNGLASREKAVAGLEFKGCRGGQENVHQTLQPITKDCSSDKDRQLIFTDLYPVPYR